MLIKQQFPFVDVTFLPSAIDRRGIVALQDHRDKLLNIMDTHARRHPLIPNAAETCMLPSAIHQECAEEVYLFCVRHDLPDAWAYLACEWYCAERWRLWARSVVPGVIPCASTTMMIESHWSLVKRHHLVRSPRARLDKVIHVLLEDTIPHHQQKWRQSLLLRRYLLHYEEEFLKDWNSLADNTDIDCSRYLVDVNGWICNCPAYAKSRFLICKHLWKVSVACTVTSIVEFAR
jgi:hypothetical protein